MADLSPQGLATIFENLHTGAADYTFYIYTNKKYIFLPNQKQCPQLSCNQFALQPRWPVGSSA